MIHDQLGDIQLPYHECTEVGHEKAGHCLQVSALEIWSLLQVLLYIYFKHIAPKWYMC